MDVEREPQLLGQTVLAQQLGRVPSGRLGPA
jgi:hypothetical protein